MTDQTNPERGTEQPSEGLPIPKLETPSSDSSPSAADIDAIADKVAQKIQRDLRMAQSTKDKEIAAIKKKLEMGDLSELEEMGASIPDNVKWEYRFRQLEKERTDSIPSTQQTSSPGNGAALSAQDVSEAVQSFGLDANTPEVLEALRGTYRSKDHFESTLAKLALGKANKPTPSPAASTAMQASPASTEKSPQQLEAEYQKELGQIAQTKRGEEKIRAIAAVKAKYREAGLNKL